ncbi:MAG: hypothetical protein ACHP7D_04520, partial [Lysobacterales bacterium]
MPTNGNGVASRVFKVRAESGARCGRLVCFMTGEKNMTNMLLRDAIRRGLHLYGIAGATLAAGTFAMPAMAQDAAQDTQSQKLETITVTGSNIRRVD